MPHAMHRAMDHVSLLAIVATTIAVMVLGYVWFALLFEPRYAAALGRAGEPKTQPAPLYFIGPLLCSLVTTIASAILMRAQHVASFGEALGFGAIVGVGYLAATAMNMAITLTSRGRSPTGSSARRTFSCPACSSPRCSTR